MFNITFQQIEAFLTVARYLNLTKAADSMYITTSALSKSLQRFEEATELQLLVRSNHGVELTDRGKYLYSALEPLYLNINKAIVTAKAMMPTQVPSLNIYVPSSYDLSSSFNEVRRIIWQYKDKYPHVRVTVTLGEFRDLRQALEFSIADIVIAQDFSITDLDDISFKRISKHDLFLAMSNKHPLAAQDDIQFSKLSNEIFYAVPIPRELSTLNKTLERCRILGFEPKGLEFVLNTQTLLHYIRQGSGMSICGKFDRTGSDDIKYYPLPDLEKYWLVAAWRIEKPKTEVQDFIELIQSD